jgi:tRNA 2-thiouridine synthesizing protein A
LLAASVLDSLGGKLQSVNTPKTSIDSAAGEAGWDAGDLGCGELVLELRSRLAAIPPGSTFRLLAHDPAAREDLPAWCRMTGHTLVRAAHPEYLLKRKES